MNKNINQEKIMKRRNAKVYFDNEDMDFNLMWVLGQASAGGAELGECIHVATAVEEQGRGKLDRRMDGGRAAAGGSGPSG